jgi:hypothetical protein
VQTKLAAVRDAIRHRRERAEYEARVCRAAEIRARIEASAAQAARARAEAEELETRRALARIRSMLGPTPR